MFAIVGALGAFAMNTLVSPTLDSPVDHSYIGVFYSKSLLRELAPRWINSNLSSAEGKLSCSVADIAASGACVSASRTPTGLAWRGASPIGGLGGLCDCGSVIVGTGRMARLSLLSMAPVQGLLEILT